MPRKNVLDNYQLVVDGDMSGVITSDAVGVGFLDNIGIQLNFAGTPTGDFEIQGSGDFERDSQGVITNPGNWNTLNIVLSAVGVADTIFADLNQLAAPFVRVVYTPTAGTGVLNVFVTGKEV